MPDSSYGWSFEFPTTVWLGTSFSWNTTLRHCQMGRRCLGGTLCYLEGCISPRKPRTSRFLELKTLFQRNVGNRLSCDAASPYPRRTESSSLAVFSMFAVISLYLLQYCSCLLISLVLVSWNLSSRRSHYGPGVDSASNRNEYQ